MFRIVAMAMAGLVALLAAGCGPFPRDIEGTFDRVGSSRTIRVGLIEGSLSPADRARAAAYLARLGRATGAASRVAAGAAEPLLSRLETGELDLVIGEVARDSPWATEVAIVEPLAEHDLGERHIGLSPIARNGENRWIALLEREVRDMLGQA